MSIIDTYSKRFKRDNGMMPDVYVYDEIPLKLRVQIVHIYTDFFEDESYFFEMIHDQVAREIGVFDLPYKGRRNNSRIGDVKYYFLQVTNFFEAIDLIEIIFCYMTECVYMKIGDSEKCNKCIAELNERFKENGVGYCFESGQIMRIDSQFAHEKIIKPALTLLSDKRYKGAESEFLRAHKHYRFGRNMEALVDCLKSFESTMKVIIDKRKWDKPKKETASALVKVCLNNGLIPEHQENYLKGLANILINSTATFRNQEAGHGQGSEEKKVPDYIVSHVLNMTASTIIFFVNAEEKLHE